MQRKIRVLVGKPGLDGHDRGAKVVAAALRDAGMEVVYTGLHQTPAQIVEAAIQEDVDVVALSILSGAHMTLFPEILELMKARGIGDKLLSGGGIIPAEDMETLTRMGVGKLFGPGASTQDIAAYLRDWFVSVHGADSLAPMPAPRSAVASTDAWAPGPAASPEPARARPAAAPTPAKRRAAPARRKPAAKHARARKAAPKRAPKRSKTTARKKAAKARRKSSTSRPRTAAKRKAPAARRRARR